MCLEEAKLIMKATKPIKVFRVHVVLTPDNNEQLAPNHLYEVSPFRNTEARILFYSYNDTDNYGLDFYEKGSQAGWHVFLNKNEANIICKHLIKQTKFRRNYTLHEQTNPEFFVRPILIPAETPYWVGLSSFVFGTDDFVEITAKCARALCVDAI